MWTVEEVIQKPTPHTERKALLMCSDRLRRRMFLCQHTHVLTVRSPISCECGLIGNQNIAGKMGIDASLVDVPSTKGGRT